MTPSTNAWAGRWTLRPDTVYLNHGSFGPSPDCVIEASRQFQRRLESQPMDFLIRELGPLLADARRQLGRLVGVSADDLVFVDNATFGMNVVAASFPLQAGDEVLLNDHEYGAVFRVWEAACQRAGARVVRRPLPLPVRSADEAVQTLLAGVTPRTRLLVTSHVTSPTALVLPIEAICREAQQRGVAVCVDGPHAVAMRPIDLQSLDCDFYTASCHKWLSAPFGSGFLYVHARRQAAVRSPVVSWGRPLASESASWRDELVWLGTRDPSAYLAVPAAIAFLDEVGWTRFREQTHTLAQYARAALADLTGLTPLTPDDDAWYGSMVAAALPPGEAEALHQSLRARYGIEIPVIDWQGQRLIRVSCHLYNTQRHIDALIEALAAEGIGS